MKCEGCGIEIQVENSKKPGYIPKDVLEERLVNNEEVVCQRCFKLKHYNHLLPLSIESDFAKDIDKIIKDFKTIIWVVDAIDFEGTFRKEIAQKLTGKNVVLIVNKIDLLPKSTSYTQFKKWLFIRIKEMNVNILENNVKMISVKSGIGVEKAKRFLNQIEKEKALVIGVTNVGKSSFLNKISGKDLTISAYAGTTLKVLKTKITDIDLELYDSPGIFTQDRLCDFFDVYSQVKMIPSKKLLTKTFTVNKRNVLFVSGLFWIRVLENGVRDLPPIMTLFVPEGISAHRAKEERVEELLSNRKVLFPPYYESFSYDTINFEKQILKIEKGNDLAISGAGWLSIKRGPLIAEISKPKELSISIRKSMK
jgi:hypothetical protein